jgi:hypothetical protein
MASLRAEDEEDEAECIMGSGLMNGQPLTEVCDTRNAVG